jgi:hypothetical protein
MALAIASFIEDSEISSAIHINPNLLSGRNSEPGLNIQIQSIFQASGVVECKMRS